MGSREKTGERLRSNRLKRGVETEDSTSDPADLAISFRRFNGAGGWPRMGHPESVQVLGNILVVSIKKPLTDGDSRSTTLPPMRVLFMDASDPENLQIVNEFVPADMDFPGNRKPNGGIVSITRLVEPGQLSADDYRREPRQFPVGQLNEKMWFLPNPNSATRERTATWIRTARPIWRRRDSRGRYSNLWQADGE